jgi:fructosamine-3-kinase
MNKEVLEHISKSLSKHLNSSITVKAVQQVHGGDINQTYILETNDQNIFLKLNDNSKPDMFEKEFNGLQLLRSTNAITVPQPFIHGSFEDEIYLVMQSIEKGVPAINFWKSFAYELAALHRNSNEQFGLNENNYIGSLPQRNDQCKTWTEFYATQRILFLIKMAFDDKKCERTEIQLAEKICNKLDDLFPSEPSSLLHGDLWSGNFMVDTEGKAVIYDSAVYYGHREMDVGMTLLFAGFDKSFYEHYNEAFPLEKGWRQRVELTQLYPLLVHLILFGGHYYNSVRNILKKFAA